ncbi:dTDP-4-dehydrorhamnose reductase [Sphingosinicella sp. CPCC 101087]|uniref:dTDP-4-dehydrorhamnose reductase n=1 Tax=Sphingosinicella sp. CPCC 101087 TaxID=2497754 RepID=UPI00101CF014|nr:dTDP-4-dehydrorhamnose reductase [Sphingosinicella sp. CPCC 101087]
MKALVFGALGQVGRSLSAVTPAGVEVVACGRNRCDIGNADEIEREIERAGPQLVINAAAYTAVDRAEEEAERATMVNAVAPGIIAERARAAGARTIHISTDFVFDGCLSRPYRPDDPPAPQGVYARTKHEGELAVTAADPCALIVRTAWVYAAQGANFVRTMLRLMAERNLVRVVDDQIGTPTAATSLARAVWGLAERHANGIHHFTDAGVASWYDFAVAVKEEAAALQMVGNDVDVIPIRAAEFPTPAPRPRYSVLDKSATWTLLGEPAPHWRANLRIVLKELKEVG